MGLHERLRSARVDAGHRVASTFAGLVGVQPNTVYRIERGDLKPSIVTLREWARVCGVTADSLLAEDDTEPTVPTNEAPATAPLSSGDVSDEAAQ